MVGWGEARSFGAENKSHGDGDNAAAPSGSLPQLNRANPIAPEEVTCWRTGRDRNAGLGWMGTPPSLDSLGSVPQARHPPDPEQLPTPAGACAGRPELPDLPGLAFPAGYRTAKLPIEMDILVSIRQIHPRITSLGIPEFAGADQSQPAMVSKGGLYIALRR
ncbi:unnamed protein product, partial [Clonostachys byssicola]